MNSVLAIIIYVLINVIIYLCSRTLNDVKDTEDGSETGAACAILLILMATIAVEVYLIANGLTYLRGM